MFHTPRKRRLPWLSLSILVIGLDQLIKHWIANQISLNQQLEILPFFNLTHTLNRGAAWGFLNTAGGWQIGFFAIIAILASMTIVMCIYRLPPKNHWFSCALSLLLGGVIGNLIDRISHGSVVDFIQLHYHSWYFPDFNIADSAITIGTALLILSLMKQNQHSSNLKNLKHMTLFNRRR